MEVLSYTDARANLKDVMDRVVGDKTQVIVTRQKAGSVVVMSLDDWNSIEETLHLLSTRANAERLRESIQAADAGEVAEHELIKP